MKIYSIIALSIFWYSCQPSIPKEKFSINSGEEKYGFVFKENQLKRQETLISFDGLNPDHTIMVFPSPNGKYFVMVKWDSDYGGQQLIVTKSETNYQVTKIADSPVGVIGDTVVWDTQDRFAAVSVMGEVQSGIHLIDIARKKSGAIRIKDLTKNRCEIQSIQKDFVFTEAGTLQFHVDIGLNPWWDVPGENLRCTEGKFYPTYLITIDLKTLEVEYQKD